MSAASGKHTGLGNQKKPPGWESPPPLPAPDSPEFSSWASQKQADTSGGNSGMVGHTEKPRNASAPDVNPHRINLDEHGAGVSADVAAMHAAQHDIANDTQFSQVKAAPAKTKLGGGEIDPKGIASFQASLIADRKSRGIPEEGDFKQKKAEYEAKGGASSTGTPEEANAMLQSHRNASDAPAQAKVRYAGAPKPARSAQAKAPVSAPAEQPAKTPDVSSPSLAVSEVKTKRSAPPRSQYGNTEPGGQGTLFAKTPYKGRYEGPGDRAGESVTGPQFADKMTGQRGMFTGKGEVAPYAKAPAANRRSPQVSRSEKVTPSTAPAAPKARSESPALEGKVIGGGRGDLVHVPRTPSAHGNRPGGGPTGHYVMGENGAGGSREVSVRSEASVTSPSQPSHGHEESNSVGSGWGDGGQSHYHVHNYYGGQHIGDNYVNNGGMQNIGSNVSIGSSGASQSSSRGAPRSPRQSSPSQNVNYGRPSAGQYAAHVLLNSTVNGKSVNDRIFEHTGRHVEQTDTQGRRIGDVHSDAHKAKNVAGHQARQKSAASYQNHYENMRSQRQASSGGQTLNNGQFGSQP